MTHAPGLDVDLDNGDMAGIGKRAGGIVGRAFGDARRDLALEAMDLMIGGARQRLESGWRGRCRRRGRHRLRARCRAADASSRMPAMALSFARTFRAASSDGAAGDDQRAAGEGAPAIGRAVGIAVHDLDAVRRSSELVGDDLGERGAQALAVRRRADPRLDRIRMGPWSSRPSPSRASPPCRARQMPACRSRCARRTSQSRGRDSVLARAPAFWRARNAGTSMASDRHFHGLGIARLVEHQARRRRIGKRLDQVAPADLDRIECRTRPPPCPSAARART